MYRSEHMSDNDNSEEEDHKLKHKMPKEGVEILPSDLDMDHINDNREALENIEIDRGVNWLSSGGNELKEILQIQNFSEEKSSKSKEGSDYIDLLQLKIRKQANRLCELQEYKSVCEKRITQLNPGHELPVTDKHLTQSGSNSYSTEIQISNMISSYKFQIQDLTNKLVQKENEKRGIVIKYEELQKKHNHYVSESIPRSALKTNSNTNLNSAYSSSNAFPNAERIPNEKMREAYTKLLNTFREVTKEKEQILDSLKFETINSEEQRNYIEILKQTMENNLQKNGLLQILERQRAQHYTAFNNYNNCTSSSNTPYKTQGNSNLSAVDVLIDVVQLKNEIDKCRREAVAFEVTVNELQNEIEFLRDANSQMNMKKDKIREGLEKGIKELEDAKEKLSGLEQEKVDLSEELNEMRDCCENLLRENEDLFSYRNECSELKSKLENQKILEEKLIEYKNNFVLINNQLEEVLTEKKNLESEREKFFNYFEENKILKEENGKILQINKENEERLDSMKRQNEIIKGKNNELSENLNNSINLLNDAEKNLENFKLEYEKISSQCKENVEKKLNYDLLCKELSGIKSDRESLENENIKLRKMNSDISNENEKLRSDGNDFSKNFNKLLQQLETKNKSYKNLENLHAILKIEKENLSKEISSLKVKEKSLETNSSKKKLNTTSSCKDSEIKKLKKEIEDLRFSQSELEISYKSEMQNLKNQIDQLQKEKENISDQKLLEKEKHIKILQEDLEKNKQKLNSFQSNSITTHEQLLHDLRSFKNDNKKLYDHNKKLQEENSKIFFLKKDNKNMQNFLTMILNLLPNKNLAKLYHESLNYTEQISGVEFEKSKIMKKIQSLEKEIYRIKIEKNFSPDDKNLEIKLTSDLKDSNDKLIEFDKRINEFRQALYKLQVELKTTEGGEFDLDNKHTNVFKANYIEKEKNSLENFSFEGKGKLRESEKTSEGITNTVLPPSRANRYANYFKEENKREMPINGSDRDPSAIIKAKKPGKESTIRREVVLSNLSQYNTSRSRSRTYNNKSNRSSPSSSRVNINIDVSDVSDKNSVKEKNTIRSLIKNGIPLNQINLVDPTSTLYYKRAFDIDTKMKKK